MIEFRVAIAGRRSVANPWASALERAGDQRWAHPDNAVASAAPDDHPDVLDRQRRRDERLAQTAVDLQIEQRRRDPADGEVGRPLAGRRDGDAAAGARSMSRTCPVR
ncbi:MAG: hypothetical protein U0797_20870 [Gemmataceae bacterium]